VDLTELAFYDVSGLPALEDAIAARMRLLVVAPARPEAARAFAGAWGRLPLARDARAALDELATGGDR
jgi:hypothetical protein